MMDTVTNVSGEIDNRWRAYSQGIVKQVDFIFYNDILPILKVRGWWFLTGNGNWWIFDENKQVILDEYLPIDLVKILNLKIPGFPADSVGTLMPSYMWDEIKES